MEPLKSDPPDIEKEASAAAAFTRFVELTSTPEGLLETPKEEFLSLTEPFLRNARHRSHVEMIFEAVASQQLKPLMRFGRIFYTSIGLSFLYKKVWQRVWLRWNERAEERQKELRENVTPGAVIIDLLPAKLVDTVPEWRSAGKQAYLLETRVDVEPTEDFVPASLALRVELMGGMEARMIDSSPKSEIAEEADVTREGELIETISADAKVSAGLKTPALSVGAETKSSESVQVAQKVSMRGKVTTQRVVSAAVGKVARWQLLRTAVEAPIGGRNFLATVLVEGKYEALPVAVSAIVEFEGWGEVRAESVRDLPLPQQA